MFSEIAGRSSAVAAAQNPEPAPASMVALMWRAVSTVHGVRARRHDLHLATPADTRLGEQLTMLPFLQDWRPVTAVEAEELTALLRMYAEAVDDGVREKVAGQAAELIRWMAADRATGTPYPD